MGVNKVAFDNDVLIDISEDTVTPDTLLTGVTAHNNSGEEIVGALSMVDSKIYDIYINSINENTIENHISFGELAVIIDTGYTIRVHITESTTAVKHYVATSSKYVEDVYGGKIYLTLYSITTDSTQKVSYSNLIISGDLSCIITQNEVFNYTPLDAYPVGAVYLSFDATSPSILFGGVWSRLGTGRMLISAGGDDDAVIESNTQNNRGSADNIDVTWFPVNETGGETDHMLGVSEIPSHRHDMNGQIWSNGTGSGSAYVMSSKHGLMYRNTGYTGGGASHNNIPPYIAVYMWRRVS